MRTRTLLLLAATCGLVILVAGGVKLFQVAEHPQRADLLALGAPSTLGDMTVSVLSVDRSGGATVVVVEMQGVDGAGAAVGWRLLADGRPTRPDAGTRNDAPPPCDEATTSAVEPLRCALTFPAADSVQAVAYLRAGLQRQWTTA